MSLESLTNPLERLQYLPTALQLRPSDFPPSSSYVYSDLITYFLNDVAFSAADDAAYVYTGGLDQITSVSGGGDPSTRSDWTLMSGAKSTKIEPASVGPALGALSFANNTLVVPAGSKWLVHVHGLATKATAYAATDSITIGVTSSGTGGLGENCDNNAVPSTGVDTNFQIANSFYVEAGTTSSTLTVTATAHTVSQNFTQVVAAFIRLA
jgi:hypothetical protein